MFQRRASINVRLVAFSVISIVLMAVDYQRNYLTSVRSILSATIYPLQYVVNLPFDAVEWITDSLVTRENIIEENERLKQEHLLFSSKLQRYAILEAENQRLRQLLGSSFSLHDRVLVAELIEVNLQSFRRQFVINKGKRDGAYNGQPIVDASGIMGQIVYAGPFSSTVLLITDSNHALPVQVNRNGLRAIAVGTGHNDKLMLEHLPKNADIKIGDLIISSGLGRRFPSGYPVGEVEDITLDPGEPFVMALIKPSAQFGKNREVLMVWPYEHINPMNGDVTEVTKP